MLRRSAFMPAQPDFLSYSRNSTPGSPCRSRCSPLPITHDNRVPGQAACNVCTSGTTWVTSPSADRRSRQMEEGAGGMVIARLRRMTGYDATEGLTPFREDGGIGAILFDLEVVRQ